MPLRTELPLAGGSKPATGMQALLQWSLIILGLVVLLFAQSARAGVAVRVQAQPVTDPIQAFVTVTDANGAPVPGLTPGNFTMLVDGVTVTAPVSQPPAQDTSQHVSVVFAMDYSPSVVDTHVAVMRQAVIDFINTLKVGDYAAIVKFNVTNPNGASVVLPFTRIDGSTGTQALIAAVNADYTGRESNIFDGVTVSVGHFAAPPAPLPSGPKAIILVTDGDENNSNADINTAIAAAVAAGTPIFTVGIGDYSSATSQQILNALPNGTGGTFYPAPTDADVNAAYAQIRQLLNNEYVITYTPSPNITDCATHTLVVKVTGQADATANFTRCATTLVPDVRTMTIAEATAALANAGLVVGSVTDQNSTSAIGSMIAQSPSVGAVVIPGSAVNLTRSNGVPVPNVVGMTEAAARTAIETAGLRVSSATQQSSATVASGTVISQSPTSGLVAGSSPVSLVVSSGPAKSSSGGGGGAMGLLEVLAGLLLTGLLRRRRNA